jgi:hypothetical protein
MLNANQEACRLAADSDSKVAWHRAQLKRNREALKALEPARFSSGHGKIGQTEKTIVELRRKIADSERCIADHDRRARRPLGTDFTCLTNVSWGTWSAHNG